MDEGRGCSRKVASGLRVHELGDQTLVTAHGEIDLAVLRNAAALCQAVARRGLPLVVDATDVTFVDSAGMSVLVRLARDAEAGGYPVVLRNAPWAIKELLIATGIVRLLPFAEGETTPERPAPPVDEPDA